MLQHQQLSLSPAGPQQQQASPRMSAAGTQTDVLPAETAAAGSQAVAGLSPPEPTPSAVITTVGGQTGQAVAHPATQHPLSSSQGHQKLSASAGSFRGASQSEGGGGASTASGGGIIGSSARPPSTSQLGGSGSMPYTPHAAAASQFQVSITSAGGPQQQGMPHKQQQAGGSNTPASIPASPAGTTTSSAPNSSTAPVGTRAAPWGAVQPAPLSMAAASFTKSRSARVTSSSVGSVGSQTTSPAQSQQWLEMQQQLQRASLSAHQQQAAGPLSPSKGAVSPLAQAASQGDGPMSSSRAAPGVRKRTSFGGFF
jgi:hypothetical protein